MEEIEQLEKLLRHIELVNQNTLLLGKKLILLGESVFGRRLIANGLRHDYSKFFGAEWETLTGADVSQDALAAAVSKHNKRNKHHPEYWGSIHKMPRLYVAEMVCDWKARATEFGTSLMDWIDGDAQKRFGFTKEDDVYETIVFFVNLLCDKPFSQQKVVIRARKPRAASKSAVRQSS